MGKLKGIKIQLVSIIGVLIFSVCGLCPFTFADVTVKEERDLIRINNGLIGITFNKKQGFDLVGITDIKNDYNFINVSGPDTKGSNLWKVSFVTSVGRISSVDNSVECSATYDIVDVNDGKNIHFYWKGITVSNEQKNIDVHAVVTLKNNSPLSLWRIEVTNRSSKLGIENVNYPIVSNIGKPKSSKEKEYLVYPWGKVPRLVENPLQGSSMPETLMPYDECGIQVSTYYVGNKGLYLATHDPAGNKKKYRYYPETVNDTQVFSYTFIHLPTENMGKPNTDYVMPYDTVIGIYKGDWYEAAKLYREWVTKEAVWCKKGPLHKRKDIAKWFLDSDMWMLRGDGNVENFKVFMEDIPVSAEIVWWQWRHKDTKQFDTEYPDYFPATDWFNPLIDQLHKLGIPVMPYTNGMSWCMDYTSPSYIKENAEKYAIRLKSGEISTHHANGRNYAIMCAKTKVWQDKMLSVVQRLVTEHKVDGVYLDQAGFGTAEMCFDDSHGHPVGSGNSQSAGYREMMERISQAVNKGSEPTIAFTTEANTETVVGTFDGLLLAHYAAPDMIPFFQFVYHDYQICFGRWHGLDYGKHAHKRMGEFSLLAGQSFVWGDQLGWVFPSMSIEQPKAANYLKNLGKARHSARKFLLYGQMLTPPRLDKELPTISFEWWANSPTATSPAVLYSAWKSPDGAIGLVFTNISESSQTISYSLNLKDYGLPGGNKYIVNRVGEDGELTVLSDYQSSDISRSESLEPYSALVLEMSNVTEERGIR
ncbi:MAG: hypothetical protein HY606_09490 [Planctomycetes bacterium]|nr:hypothetical protein [Planctomycetota bacterium]